jgi:hypothetical protein
VSGWTKYHQNIQAQLGALPRRVLVLEGPDDKTFVESLLTRRQPGAWQASWVLGEAGGKGNVLEILAHEPTWQGLIDRDEWTRHDVLAQQALFPNRLHMLPRYCMESYFTVPTELWAMLEPAQQAGVVGGQVAFEAALTTSVRQWVRHGSLWHTVNPLWAGIRALGFKEDLLQFVAAQQGDAAIKAKLAQWHNYLEPQAIMDSFKANLAAALADPLFRQLTEWIHGKHYFRESIATTLPGLLGMRLVPAAPKTLANLQQKMEVPADLQPIWTAIGLP